MTLRPTVRGTTYPSTYGTTAGKHGGEPIPPPPPPNAPTGLQIDDNSNGLVSMSWTAPAAGETPLGYKIYRATSSGGPYTLAGQTGGLSFVDSPPVTGTYYWVVRAYNLGGDSPDSNEVSDFVDVPIAPPSAPRSLQIAGTGEGYADLAWLAPDAGPVDSYSIKRSTSSGGPYVEVGTTASLVFTDSSIAVTDTYYWVVTAINSGGEGPESNQVSATITAPPYVYYNDRFDNLDNWTVITGNPVASNNQVSPNGQAYSMRFNNPLGEKEQVIEIHVSEPEPSDNVYIWLAANEDLTEAYEIVLKASSPQFRLFRLDAGVETLLQSAAGTASSINNFVWRRCSAEIREIPGGVEISVSISGSTYLRHQITENVKLGRYVGIGGTLDLVPLEDFFCGDLLVKTPPSAMTIVSEDAGSIAMAPQDRNVCVGGDYVYAIFRSLHTDATQGIWVTQTHTSLLTTSKFKIADTIPDLDVHYGGSIAVDSAGYIHAIYNNRGPEPIRYRRSLNPHDVSAWGTEYTVDASEDGTAYLALVITPTAAAGADRMSIIVRGHAPTRSTAVNYVIWTDNLTGNPTGTWTYVNHVSRWTNGYSHTYPCSMGVDHNNHLHQLWTHVILNYFFRSTVNYAKSEDGGLSWKNAAGQDLALPTPSPTGGDNRHDLVSYMHPGYPSGIDVRPSDRPVVLYGISGEDTDMGVNVIDSYHPTHLIVAEWDGTRWNHWVITDRIFSSDLTGQIVCHSETEWVVFAVYEDKPSKQSTMYRYKTTDGGANWTEEAVYSSYHPRSLNVYHTPCIESDMQSDVWIGADFRHWMTVFKSDANFGGTPSAPVAAIPYQQPTIYEDTFDGAAETPLSTYNPAWTEHQGSWKLTGDGAVYCEQSGLGSADTASIYIGRADVVIKDTCIIPTGQTYIGWCVRRTLNEFIEIYIEGDQTHPVSFRRNINGTRTGVTSQILFGNYGKANVDMEVEICLAERVCMVIVDGELAATFNDVFNLDEVEFGFWGWGQSANGQHKHLRICKMGGYDPNATIVVTAIVITPAAGALGVMEDVKDAVGVESISPISLSPTGNWPATHVGFEIRIGLEDVGAFQQVFPVGASEAHDAYLLYGNALFWNNHYGEVAGTASIESILAEQNLKVIGV